MSVVGWDTLTARVSDAENELGTLDQNKLPKLATASIVYSNNSAGVPSSIATTDAPTASTVPIRTTNGQVRVGTPALTDAATPKSYVDPFNTAPTAGGTATAITIDATNFLLVQGGKLAFIASAGNNGAATTINGKPLYKPNTTTAPTLVAGKMYTVCMIPLVVDVFFCTSAEGTAVAGDVLAGKTFSNDNDTAIVGTFVPPQSLPASWTDEITAETSTAITINDRVWLGTTAGGCWWC
jgi:hypothetical protein